MKNNRKLFGLIAVVMVAMLAFAACGNGSTDDDPPDPVQKKLTITGLTGFNGETMVMLYPMVMEAEGSIGAKAEVPPGSTSFTFDLIEYDGLDGIPWTGSADVYVFLIFEDMGLYFVYTNGNTLAELGITDFMAEMPDSMEKLPKLAFNKNVTTVNLVDKFKSVSVGP